MKSSEKRNCFTLHVRSSKLCEYICFARSMPIHSCATYDLMTSQIIKHNFHWLDVVQCQQTYTPIELWQCARRASTIYASKQAINSIGKLGKCIHQSSIFSPYFLFILCNLKWKKKKKRNRTYANIWTSKRKNFQMQLKPSIGLNWMRMQIKRESGKTERVSISRILDWSMCHHGNTRWFMPCQTARWHSDISKICIVQSKQKSPAKKTRKLVYGDTFATYFLLSINDFSSFCRMFFITRGCICCHFI